MTLTAFLEFQRATTAHGGRASTLDLLADVFRPQPNHHPQRDELTAALYTCHTQADRGGPR